MMLRGQSELCRLSGNVQVSKWEDSTVGGPQTFYNGDVPRQCYEQI